MSITSLLMPDWMFASIGRNSPWDSGFGLRLTLELLTPKNAMGGQFMPRRRVLESEPCLEEIAYALDRALRKRETDFPIIGIFPESLDRDLIPSAIATRLYVNLRGSEWKLQIAQALGDAKAKRSIPKPPPYFFQVHSAAWGPCIEIRPRSGRWHPFYVMVLPNEKDRITGFFTGPSGYPVNSGSITWGDCSSGEYEGRSTINLVDFANQRICELF